jgi:hypothetical protein
MELFSCTHVLHTQANKQNGKMMSRAPICEHGMPEKILSTRTMSVHCYPVDLPTPTLIPGDENFSAKKIGTK